MVALCVPSRSTRDGVTNVSAKASDGTGAVEALTPGLALQFAATWSPDGETLVFSQAGPEVLSADLIALSIDDGTVCWWQP